MHVSQNWIDIAYLIAACLFVVGIKGLTKPKTAVRGNLLAAAGMGVAAVVTLLNEHIVTYEIIIAGVVVGGLIGAVMAKKVQMTSMPQMIALLNGFGGGASFAVASAEFFRGSADSTVSIIATGAAVLIGAVTLTGSLVAFAKLQELIDGKPMGFPGMKLVNGLLFIGSVVAVGYLVVNPGNEAVFWGLVAAAAVLGLFLVLPIGGADMPVVIALLNSYSGVAASAAGFVMGNSALIITGSLVGASGLILTSIMCKAMNRSLTNVLFGVMAEAGEAMDEDEVYAGKVKSTSSEEVAMLLETAQRVVIVPGFGLAMAQAQHAVRDMADTLEAMGCEVEYAIHPVAGRMPGHMNVLLAEAEVSYDKLKDMDAINPTFEQTDVAIVLGANDVTNPLAREDKGSPIYGMPILNVDKAKTVVVVKRSLSAGFAGLPNPLFAKDNTLMLFGDGKGAVLDITTALKEG
ncbi:MAG: NAD synthetase [Alcanivoracaceae bacterium]|uniref:NAD(P) transhydrogenase subunit beta n=1 Tax=Alcanivorax profundi TaxID=2338368 RepID=A0A418Y370_9GAMM|nr:MULTISPECIES: NAD(P)(+) transhydrogenase (Re/Si-specific) subunit beta [Alcanivorax]MAX55354.1 NAD synthetase [Alcanivoracaceae bacterium]MCG8439157.1 NAD(P)(+) transhydrogenase (Re/Si-specific) subunit beta [Pseudomonadales bacterium]MEE2870264.1 NAD(P)(+) transhydrogenase (Re/Si-specific) subunit beta [Pseudomonadota bacterium]ERP92814.1 NAD(P) transhydrogenase subunit beta [Alcanivorax sp. P2S70]PNE02088.1 NAD(P) transhydrogenase subunit beta [Alcanivorax sp. MD8A]|tara:strand:+ start:1530 stop:2912 length:1383 start_codon:yes stop_codon:yes gene_type:complete